MRGVCGQCLFSLLVWLAAFPVGAAPAGSATFVIGEVTATNPAGRTRILARSDVVFPGELIETRANGRAQLRFNDGAMISLQPDTSFRIEAYRFSNRQDGSEQGFFRLLRGGLRAITGLIGKRNKERFQLRTAVATIGIRGTAFSANLQQQLTVHVTEGAVIVFNRAGELLLQTGQTGEVKTADSPPRVRPSAAGIDRAGGLPGTQTGEFSAGEGRDGAGESDVIEPPPPPPPPQTPPPQAPPGANYPYP